jgi:hypothetical protein
VGKDDHVPDGHHGEFSGLELFFIGCGQWDSEKSGDLVIGSSGDLKLVQIQSYLPHFAMLGNGPGAEAPGY